MLSLTSPCFSQVRLVPLPLVLGLNINTQWWGIKDSLTLCNFIKQIILQYNLAHKFYVCSSFSQCEDYTTEIVQETQNGTYRRRREVKAKIINDPSS